MRLRFLHGISPKPQVLSTPAGTLYCFGAANVAWEKVAELLAGGRMPDAIRGSFAFVWEGEHETIAAVDHVATYPIFYSSSQISHIFHELLLATPEAAPNPAVEFEIQFLGGQSFGSEETTYKQISRILPGHYLRGGRQTPYIDFYSYEGNEALDLPRFSDLVEARVRDLAREENALLLSGGTDSVALAGIIRKLGLQDRFRFVHAYSGNQALTESHIVSRIAREMGIQVTQSRVDFSGDILPGQSGRQFSFWIENPFPAKRLAIESAGVGHCRIFTGELGDQLFGGPKNSALQSYALQNPRFSADELAALWINLSASYGRNHGFKTFGKIELLFEENPGSREAYLTLQGRISSLFSKLRGKDFLNRLMMMNFLIKGPYRTWAYSQDELDWAHPFSSWEIFDFAFRLRAEEKIGPGGSAKAILLNAWRPYLSALPWSIPKHGFGIPARSKLRTSAEA
jgi:asparagine synthetase B (glutamine-hydrolysing)